MTSSVCWRSLLITYLLSLEGTLINIIMLFPWRCSPWEQTVHYFTKRKVLPIELVFVLLCIYNYNVVIFTTYYVSNLPLDFVKASLFEGEIFFFLIQTYKRVQLM